MRANQGRCRSAARPDSPVDGEAVESVDQVSSGDVALDQAAEAFTGVFIHNGHDLDRSAVGMASNWKSTTHPRSVRLRSAGSVSLRRPGASVGAVTARARPRRAIAAGSSCG